MDDVVRGIEAVWKVEGLRPWLLGGIVMAS